MLFAVRVVGLQVREQVSELPEPAAEGVVFAVVEGLEVVAAADAGFAVRGVERFVGEEVVVPEEAGFVVLEFTDHCGRMEGCTQRREEEEEAGGGGQGRLRLRAVNQRIFLLQGVEDGYDFRSLQCPARKPGERDTSKGDCESDKRISLTTIEKTRY